MAATNFTVVKMTPSLIEGQNPVLMTNELQGKWTYKTAIAIAKETLREGEKLVCVVESNKIMLNDDEKEEKKINI